MSHYTETDLRKILEKAYREKTGKRGGVQFPRDISIDKDNDKIIMRLSDKAIHNNMQKDESAFEGWALVLKHWIKDWADSKFILEWEKPSNINSLHYQRFLYRVKKFKELFEDWFKIQKEELLEDSKIKHQKILLVNQSGERNVREKGKPGSESHLQWGIIKYGKENLGKTFEEKFNEKNFGYQLPVGLFENKVKEGYEIFPRGSAEIDLWGVGKNEVLYIFELKRPENEKVGGLSEVFFYTMFMNDIQKGIFKYDEELTNKNFDPDIIKKTKEIRSYLLCSSIHVLLSEDMFTSLNSAMKRIKEKIIFGYIEFKPNFDFIKKW